MGSCPGSEGKAAIATAHLILADRYHFGFWEVRSTSQPIDQNDDAIGGISSRIDLLLFQSGNFVIIFDIDGKMVGDDVRALLGSPVNGGLPHGSKSE
jgi:hypothetical protein